VKEERRLLVRDGGVDGVVERAKDDEEGCGMGLGRDRGLSS
jgi:hypothetical protein